MERNDRKHELDYYHNLTWTARSDFDKWSEENPGTTMEPFQYFTHCTDADFTGRAKLGPKSTPGMWDAPLGKEGAPKGVWFAMGLYKGSLPTISPFGKNRLLVQWEKLIKDLTVSNNPPLLFLESIQFRDDQSKRNVRVILVKHGDEKTKKWCVDNHLMHLTLSKNPFMKLTDKKMMTTMTGSKMATWVVLFVPYEVDIGGCKFEKNAVRKV